MQPSDFLSWMRIRSIAYLGPTNSIVHKRPLSDESITQVAEERKKEFAKSGTWHWKVVDQNEDESADGDIVACVL